MKMSVICPYTNLRKTGQMIWQYLRDNLGTSICILACFHIDIRTYMETRKLNIALETLQYQKSFSVMSHISLIPSCLSSSSSHSSVSTQWCITFLQISIPAHYSDLKAVILTDTFILHNLQTLQGLKVKETFHVDQEVTEHSNKNVFTKNVVETQKYYEYCQLLYDKLLVIIIEQN